MSKVKINGKIYLLLLLVICLSGFVIKTTYAKFTEGYTTNESIADLNYNFNITTNIEEYELINVKADEFKILNIDVINNYSEINYYGIWYKVVNSLTDNQTNNVVVAKLENSANDASGSVDAFSTKTIALIIKNNTDINIKVKIGVSSSNASVDTIKYTSGNNLITNLSPSPILLSNVKPGSYVKYIGDNGCSGASCMGQNANYVSDIDMGYCNNKDYKYNVNGWRVAYIDNGIPYLITAGSPECMYIEGLEETTNNTDTTNTEISQNITNLNNIALNYCDSVNIYNGLCNSNSSFVINDIVFQNLTGSSITDKICQEPNIDPSCGNGNDLIDVGGYYWYSESYDEKEQSLFFWDPTKQSIQNNTDEYTNGIRPIIKLKPTTYVMGGTGTYTDPYIINDDDIVTLKSATKVNKKAGSIEGEAIVYTDANHNRTKEYLYLDGRNDYIDLGLANQSFESGITLVARIKVKKVVANNENYVLTNFENAGVGIMYKDDKRFNFQIFDTELRTVSSKNTFDLNTWYTIVGVYDNNNLKIYINGKLEGVLENTGIIKLSEVPFSLGANINKSISSPTTGHSNINISDTLIYNKSLTDDEVSKYFNNKITDYNKNNLLSYFHFDTESISDNS